MINIEDVNIYDCELDTAVDSLINYFNQPTRLGGVIDKFYNQWPEANEGEFENVLACHVINSTHEHTRTILEKTDPINGEAVKVAALYRVGRYDIDLQLDVWTPYKAKRNDVYKKIYEIINEDFLKKDSYPVGLSLVLENYFGTVARYDIVGYSFPDDERSSQEDDWRVKISFKVHFDKKMQKVVNQILETIIVDKDNITGEEFISEHIKI